MARFTKYQDVLQFFYDQLPMFQRVGSPAFKKDLTNTLALLEACGNPHQKLKTIHIAGTNGKGSTSHLIAGGLQAMGFKTGLYTSPHYKDFRERIKINGQYIEPQFIKSFVNTFYQDIIRIQPSFFEMTVALSFYYFDQKKVDFAVIETGLGGRLDSTNVITPLLSVITNISFDHMDMLGDTLEKIAFEKAGIIKPGVPVIIGEDQEEVRHVFAETAKQKNSLYMVAEKDFQAVRKTNGLTETWDIFAFGKPWITNFRLDISGPFQEKNLITAMAALHYLLGEDKNVVSKLIKFFPHFSTYTKFMGRWQILSTKPFILADSAHNEGGLQYVVRYLESCPKNKLHIVLGFVNDKEINKILAVFPKDASYYFVKANIPRGLSATLLQEKATTYGLKGKSYSSVRKGFAAAKQKLQPDDVLFVGGSIFVVAEIL
jgi:dihydrofolate synthase/folylpolyglutamate synthase